MIVKMIKNLDNKMDKMQESINKDLEELKNKHAETNNTITEIKNTLEGINSTISEEKSELVSWKIKWWQLTSEEQNKVKTLKRTEPLGQYQMHQHLKYRGPRRRREKERV